MPLTGNDVVKKMSKIFGSNALYVTVTLEIFFIAVSKIDRY